MRNPVVVIPVEAAQVCDEPEGNTFKCVMPADGVQIGQDGHRHIGAHTVKIGDIERWLNEYRRASEHRDPGQAAALFARRCRAF